MGCNGVWGGSTYIRCRFLDVLLDIENLFIVKADLNLSISIPVFYTPTELGRIFILFLL